MRRGWVLLLQIRPSLRVREGCLLLPPLLVWILDCRLRCREEARSAHTIHMEGTARWVHGAAVLGVFGVAPGRLGLLGLLRARR